MIKQISMLLRVKQLKEAQAFRAVQVKRQQVTAAQAELAEAQARVRESAATLPLRENAIYAEIMLQVVDLGDIDMVKGKVLALEKEHEKLKAAAERAAHVLARLEKELQEAVMAHRRTLKDRDKYVILTDEMKLELKTVAEHREEGEVEDLFSVKRKRPA